MSYEITGHTEINTYDVKLKITMYECHYKKDPKMVPHTFQLVSEYYMKTSLITLVFVLATLNLFAQAKFDSWNEFAKTKFEPKYYEKIGEYLFHPSFSPSLKAMEGKEIIVEGFYVPFAPEDGDYIIISKYPMSQCYFCGGGGPESIAEVNFARPVKKFNVDDLITVKGKLQLNTSDVDHVNFILKDAALLDE